MGQEFKFEIVHPYVEKINPKQDLVDIRVRYKGKEYMCSVTTTEYINTLMESYEKTRENKEGAYFWIKGGMLVLKEITEATIRTTLEDLVERGDLEEFLHS